MSNIKTKEISLIMYAEKIIKIKKPLSFVWVIFVVVVETYRVAILAWKMEMILQPPAVKGLQSWGCCSLPGPRKGVMNTI